MSIRIVGSSAFSPVNGELIFTVINSASKSEFIPFDAFLMSGDIQNLMQNNDAGYEKNREVFLSLFRDQLQSVKVSTAISFLSSLSYAGYDIALVYSDEYADFARLVFEKIKERITCSYE